MFDDDVANRTLPRFDMHLSTRLEIHSQKALIKVEALVCLSTNQGQKGECLLLYFLHFQLFLQPRSSLLHCSLKVLIIHFSWSDFSMSSAWRQQGFDLQWFVTTVVSWVCMKSMKSEWKAQREKWGTAKHDETAALSREFAPNYFFQLKDRK